MTNQLRREVINLYKQVGTSVIILASHRPFHIARAIARARAHTRKSNCACNQSHSQIGVLEHFLVTSNSGYVVWKGNGFGLFSCFTP